MLSGMNAGAAGSAFELLVHLFWREAAQASDKKVSLSLRKNDKEIAAPHVNCAHFNATLCSIEDYDDEKMAVDAGLVGYFTPVNPHILCWTAFSGTSLATRPRYWPSRSALPRSTSMARSKPCRSCCRLRQPSRSWPCGTFAREGNPASGSPKSLMTGSCCMLAARPLTSGWGAVETFPGKRSV